MKALDTAINDLRATLEAALVRDDDVNRCVAMLLFLKRLTDLADHPRAGTSFIPSEYQGVIARLSNFSWATIAKEDDPAGVVRSLLETVEVAIPALAEVSKANTLVYSLRESARAKVSLEAVFKAVAALRLEVLSDPDMLRVYQEALDAPSRHAANATTPASVRNLIARLFANESVDNVYDPAVGTGSLIAGVADRVRRNWTTPALYGQELTVDVLHLARIRGFLSKCPFDFRAGDTLLAPELAGDGRKFDLVVAHPPFGKIPPKIAADSLFTVAGATTYEAAFLQHVMTCLSDTARAAVVVPAGILFRSADRKLREQLVSSGALQAVISLPPFLFAGTDIAASILVLRGQHVAESTDVVFINLAGSITGQKTAPTLTEIGIAEAVRAVNARVAQPGFASTVRPATIAESDFDLSVARYVAPRQSEGLSLDVCLQTFVDAVARRNKTENRALALLAERNQNRGQPRAAGRKGK
jgi:type I restriction-modification system DNA methylase subunit